MDGNGIKSHHPLAAMTNYLIQPKLFVQITWTFSVQTHRQIIHCIKHPGGGGRPQLSVNSLSDSW